jgi:hypothetical protein
MDVSVIGKIKDGVVVLPTGLSLPEGSVVSVEIPEDPAIADLLKSVVKAREHLPKDFALNHGHYVSGEPKR